MFFLPLEARSSTAQLINLFQQWPMTKQNWWKWCAITENTPNKESQHRSRNYDWFEWWKWKCLRFHSYQLRNSLDESWWKWFLWWKRFRTNDLLIKLYPNQENQKHMRFSQLPDGKSWGERSQVWDMYRPLRRNTTPMFRIFLGSRQRFTIGFVSTAFVVLFYNRYPVSKPISSITLHRAGSASRRGILTIRFEIMLTLHYEAYLANTDPVFLSEFEK
jgi:hypothetical protein